MGGKGAHVGRGIGKFLEGPQWFKDGKVSGGVQSIKG